MRGRILVIFFLCCNFLMAQDDLEHWNAFEINKKINKQFSFSYKQGIRIDNYMTTFKGMIFQGSVKYKYDKHLSATIGYRENYKPFTGLARYYQNFNVKFKWSDFRFALSSQVQYERLYDDRQRAEWRDRFTVAYKIDKADFRPYGGGEVFIDLIGSEPGFSRYRYFFGVDYSMSKRTGLKLYWMSQTDIEDVFIDNIFGTSISISLK